MVPKFALVVTKLSHQVEWRGQSKSTLNKYFRQIALFVMQFNRLSEQIKEDEINEYFVAFVRDRRSPSSCSFKHMVYGLRYLWKKAGYAFGVRTCRYCSEIWKTIHR